MALTPEQIQLIKKAQANGTLKTGTVKKWDGAKTGEVSKGAKYTKKKPLFSDDRINLIMETKGKSVGTKAKDAVVDGLKKTPSKVWDAATDDIPEFGKNVFSSLDERGKKGIKEIKENAKAENAMDRFVKNPSWKGFLPALATPVTEGVKMGGELLEMGAGAGADVIGEAGGTVGKFFLTEKEEKELGMNFDQVIKESGTGDVVQVLSEWKDSLPEGQRDIIETGMASLGLATSVVGGQFGTQAGKQVIKSGTKAVGKTGQAIKNAPLKAKDAINNGVNKVGSIGNKKVDLSDRITPKLTPKERELAIKQGRVTEGSSNIFTGKKADTIEASSSVKKAIETIEKLIPNAKNLNDFELVKAITAKTKEISTALKPKLKRVEVSKSSNDKLKEDILDLMSKQADEPEFVAFAGSAKVQERFLRFTQEIKDNSSLDDVWDIRKRYDDSISESVKQASELASPSAQLQKDMWLENRKLLNNLLKEGEGKLSEQVKKDFSDMSNLYEATNNISRKAKIDTKGSSGLITKEKIIGTTGAAAAGYGASQILAR